MMFKNNMTIALSSFLLIFTLPACSKAEDLQETYLTPIAEKVISHVQDLLPFQEKNAETPVSTSQAQAGVDWTPLFKPWEKACSSSPELDKLFRSLEPKAVDKNKDEQPEKYVKGKINVPAPYQKAVFQDMEMVLKAENEEVQIGRNLVEFTDEDVGEGGYYTDNSFSVSGYYYGIPIAKIGTYVGYRSDYSGTYIILDTPVDKVRNILSAKAKFQYKQYKNDMDVEEKIGIFIHKNSEDEKQTVLSCDR